MVSTGAAFRLTWDTTAWNGANVDVIFTFDDPEEVYRLGVEALGRSYGIIARAKTPCDESCPGEKKPVEKKDFIDFIRQQIDKGYPCIALGIIGPPEACIITGYRNGGETLLGWNFFQDSIEFAADVKRDESGYFISDKWWDNDDTVAVISMGEICKPMISHKEIINNAIRVITGRFDKKGTSTYAKGIYAYDAWKKALLNEAEFPQNAVLPVLAERLMCQGDAMDCLGDGRNNAAIYMKRLAEKYPEQQALCKEIGDNFTRVVQNVWKMINILEGHERNEKQMRNLAKPEVRKQLAAIIDDCKDADSKALEGLMLLSKAL
jgi:hypothetical protein